MHAELCDVINMGTEDAHNCIMDLNAIAIWLATGSTVPCLPWNKENDLAIDLYLEVKIPHGLLLVT